MPTGTHVVEGRPGRQIVYIVYNNCHYSATGKILLGTIYLLGGGGVGAFDFHHQI